MPNYSSSATQALLNLRDPSHFQWYVVPLFAIVIYLYLVEAEKKNWNVVLAGLAYYGIEWFGEVLNSLWMHFSGYAPLWGAPSNTAFLILVGINIEITIMFSVFGMAIVKALPQNKSLKIYGIPNRILVIAGFSLFCVLVETVLNRWGALTWDYSWWGWPNIWSVILFAYAPAVAFTIWVHDLKSTKYKLKILAAVYALDIICAYVFAVRLKWI